MVLSLFQLNEIWGAPICSKNSNLNASIGPVCTDSREIVKGAFFVPLIGEKFNGHDFLDEAFKLGAQGAVISRQYKKKQGFNINIGKKKPTQQILKQTLLVRLKIFHKKK